MKIPDSPLQSLPLNICRLAIVVPLIVVALTPQLACAHMPLPAGGNETIERAIVIPDSRLSWVVYSELEPSAMAQYYRFDAVAGDSIPISLFTSPAEGEGKFLPRLVLMGPGIAERVSLPTFVEQPEEAGCRTIELDAEQTLKFEPFSPGTFRRLVEFSFEAPETGTYFVAVFDPNRSGRYGIAIGAGESFSLPTWVMLPFKFPAIYLWSGQSWFMLLAPAVLTFVSGSLMLLGRLQRKPKRETRDWLLAIAGLSIAASGSTVGFQWLIALTQVEPEPLMVVTFVLTLIPFVIGLYLSWLATSPVGRRWWHRLGQALVATIALLFWGGWIVGPALALLAAVLPSQPGSDTLAKS